MPADGNLGHPRLVKIVNDDTDRDVQQVEYGGLHRRIVKQADFNGDGS